MDNERPQSAAG